MSEELGIDLREAERALKGTGEEVWNFWFEVEREAGEEILKRVAERAVQHLMWSIEPLDPSEDRKAEVDACALLVDVRRISSFINREDLRTMVGASYLVDAYTIYAVPRAIMETFGVGPESIIYAGGGMIYAVIPALEEEAWVEKHKELERLARGYLSKRMRGLVHVAAKERLRTSWRATARRLAVKANIEKLIQESPPRDVRLGIEVLCDICRRRPAKKRSREGDFLCEECEVVREVGHKLYIHPKSEQLLSASLIKESTMRRLPERLMEWLSGADVDVGKAHNVAVVKADGNMMGVFMSTAVSLSDGIERSLRVDAALKRGLERIYERLCGEDAARVYVGALYAGGDDMLAVWPARLAIQASLVLAYWFWRELGGVRQLSIGVASGKPRHNVWVLISTAEELLKWCKDKLREEIAKSGGTVSTSALRDVMESIVGVLAMLYSDAYMPMPSWLDYLRANEYSSQPLALLRRGVRARVLGDLGELLTIPLALAKREPASGRVLDLVDEAFKSLASLRGRLARIQRDVAREVYEVAKTVMAARGGTPADASLVIAAYSLNRAIRRERLGSETEERANVYNGIVRMCLNRDFKRPAPLYDLFLLAKFAEGD